MEQGRVKGEIFRKEVMLVVVLRRQMDRKDSVDSGIHKDMEVYSVETTKNVLGRQVAGDDANQEGDPPDELTTTLRNPGFHCVSHGEKHC